MDQKQECGTDKQGGFMVTKGQIMGWLLSPLPSAISNFC